MGLPAIAVDSTVASVPGPPCTTSCTMGTFFMLETVASTSERSLISEPYAAPPAVPLSTSTKCVWFGLSGAPWRVAGLGRYGAVPLTALASWSRPFVTPQGKIPMSGSPTS